MTVPVLSQRVNLKILSAPDESGEEISRSVPKRRPARDDRQPAHAVYAADWMRARGADGRVRIGAWPAAGRFTTDRLRRPGTIAE